MEGEYGEVKRMYVRPAYRGSGFGRRILEHLADHVHPEIHPSIRIVKDCAAAVHRYLADKSTGEPGRIPMWAALERARASVEIARAGTRPDWSWSLMYGRRDPSFGDMVSFGLKFSLPLFQSPGNVAVRSNLANFGPAGLGDLDRKSVV